MKKFLGLFFGLTIIAAVIVFITQKDQVTCRVSYLNKPQSHSSCSANVSEDVIVQKVLNRLENKKNQEKTLSVNTQCSCLADAIPEITKDIIKSVVSVSVVQNLDKKGAEKNPQQINQDVLKDFFDTDCSKPKKVESGGSGFIFEGPNKCLYVLTNAHVVEDMSEITITTHNKIKLYVQIEFIDPRSDVAVLKIKGKQKLPDDCKPLVWSDSNEFPVGTTVLAFGNPFGLGSSVTQGIISFKHRDIPRPVNPETGEKGVGEILIDMMQHTASINVGSSGGPLIAIKKDKKGHCAGHLVGVNSTLICPPTSNGNVGISFATPSTFVKEIIEKLFKFGKIDYPWLGITMQSLLDQQKSSLGLSTMYDAYKIINLDHKSPAQKGGLEKGDIITHINGSQVESLTKAIQKLKPRERVEFTVLKRGLKKNITTKEILIGEKTEDLENHCEQEAEKSNMKLPENAFKIEDLNLVLSPKETLIDKNTTKGLSVVQVDNDHSRFIFDAREALSEGDIITSVNGETVSDEKSVKKLITSTIETAKSELSESGKSFAVFSFSIKKTDDSLRDAVYKYHFEDTAEN